ncbi:hypothetical protein DBR37_12255 [Herminiimonas sp. KBW02]|uniref:hypothetical protein n=1 Tax=Herminiimonas sp. KBW02 TaxID=2153363 RepID=UPI000F5AEC8E|nr:hypothetical protein [Herminiimonas sp. KBW02]RQO33899.1 hypothetical protein DBR37_12255 [Herminiimonas sp. KBW02]
MSFKRLLLEALKAGIAGAFVMPIAGMISKPIFSWHVWQYGKKSAEIFVENPSFGLLFAVHLLWSWVAALLLIAFLRKMRADSPVLLGAAVGGIYYFLVNAIALPLYFGDPFPWQQGVPYLAQPLIVLVSFAICVSFMSRRYVLSRES